MNTTSQRDVLLSSLVQAYLGIVYEWEESTGRGEAPEAVQQLWIAWVVVSMSDHVASYVYG